MHELSIVQALIEQVEGELERAGEPGPVMALDLIIGRLSGVHVDSIRFAYEVLVPGTILAEAELRITQPPARVLCHACGLEQPIDELEMYCPRCGSGETRIQGGQELLLQSIELDSQPS